MKMGNDFSSTKAQFQADPAMVKKLESGDASGGVRYRKTRSGLERALTVITQGWLPANCSVGSPLEIEETGGSGLGSGCTIREEMGA